MRPFVLSFCGLAAIAFQANATPYHIVAQPTQCITGQFSAAGNDYWKTVTLQLNNNCGQAVDFQNAAVTFKSKTALNNVSFWGQYAPLPYPDNNLVITSQLQSDNNYLAGLNLHFPSYQGSTTKLNPGQSIKIIYGVDKDNHIDNSTSVYLNTPVSTGSLVIKNNSNRPSDVSQNYALVHLTMNGAAVSDIQVPWSNSLTVPNLAEGTYDLAADSVTATTGVVYQGSVAPSHFTITANQSTNTAVTYSAVSQTGSVCINLSALPNDLSGYTNSPTATLTETGSGSSVTRALAWNNSTTISQLKSGSTYNLSTPVINYNGFNCTPTFNPASLVASATASSCSTLTYSCQKVAQETVTLNVSGAPATLSSLNVSLTPNDGSTALTQKITLSNGSGTATINLNSSVVYNVSSDSVAGYSISFSPQPLIATPNAVEQIVLTQSSASNGRIITYVPGWKTPPSAQSLASAGYTHVMVAFGVFSTSTPGTIVSAFDTVTKDYIQSLHQAGIKVILSLGGASTSIANTSVDFHQVLSLASSADAFKQKFVSSLTSMMNEYQFDGFDIDIEHGINGGGTFTNPQGDIAVLASIINTMHSQNSGLIITLTPQVANISATRGFDQTWGNYASLIGQTYNSLTWVGIQLYNTGCAFGIDLVCYDPNVTSNPNFSVAMATDLLADWPATVNGQATGFQPYISHLSPSQVVIGYPAPNASGASDGAPVTPTSTIKRAIQCLKTGVASGSSCGSYVPPKAYGMIGGVFNWEATYDQSNGFKFAKDLKNCVINSNCA